MFEDEEAWIAEEIERAIASPNTDVGDAIEAPRSEPKADEAQEPAHAKLLNYEDFLRHLQREEAKDLELRDAIEDLCRLKGEIHVARGVEVCVQPVDELPELNIEQFAVDLSAPSLHVEVEEDAQLDLVELDLEEKELDGLVSRTLGAAAVTPATCSVQRSGDTLEKILESFCLEESRFRENLHGIQAEERNGLIWSHVDEMEELQQQVRRQQFVEQSFGELFARAKKAEEDRRAALAVERKQREGQIEVVWGDFCAQKECLASQVAELEMQAEEEEKRRQELRAAELARQRKLEARFQMRLRFEIREREFMAAADTFLSTRSSKATQANVVRKSVKLSRRQWRVIREINEAAALEAEEVYIRRCEAYAAECAREIQRMEQLRKRAKTLAARQKFREEREAREAVLMGNADQESEVRDLRNRQLLERQLLEIEVFTGSEGKRREAIFASEASAWLDVRSLFEQSTDSLQKERRRRLTQLSSFTHEERCHRIILEAEQNVTWLCGWLKPYLLAQISHEAVLEEQRLNRLSQLSLAHQQRKKELRLQQQETQRSFLTRLNSWQETCHQNQLQDDRRQGHAVPLPLPPHRVWQWADRSVWLNATQCAREDWLRFTDSAELQELIRKGRASKVTLAETPVAPTSLSLSTSGLSLFKSPESTIGLIRGEIPVEGLDPMLREEVPVFPVSADEGLSSEPVVLNETMVGRQQPGVPLAAVTTVDAPLEKIERVEELKSVEALTTLLLPTNEIHSIHPGLGSSYCSKLRVLNLQDNKMDSLTFLRPAQPGGGSASAVAALSAGTPVKAIRRGSGLGGPKCSSLAMLNASMNKLETLAGVESCPSLSQLLLNNNFVAALEPLACCTNLTKLEVYRNNITSLSVLASLPFLTSFNGGRNAIGDITSCFSKSPLLTEIVLYHNQLREIPSRLHNVLLQQLWLNDNQIERLPQFSFAPLLTRLYLSGNRLRDISGLSCCLMLVSVDLSFNQISDLSQLWYFEPCRKLESVALNDNPLTSRDPALSDAENTLAHQGYRRWLVAMLPALRELDNSEVLKAERIEALNAVLTEPLHRQLWLLRRHAIDSLFSPEQVVLSAGAPSWGAVLRTPAAYPPPHAPEGS
eukprot:RCo029557